MSVDAVATPVKERPILFSGPMVLAILAGRKSQTRRTLKVQPLEIITPTKPRLDGKRAWFALTHRGETIDGNRGTVFGCRYGEVGERLWVREAFRQGDGSVSVHYRADPDEVSGGPWRPSIHMPRWASRLTVEITEVRVQRLQEITEEDAKAEGIPFDGTWYLGGTHPVKGTLQCWPFAKTAFERTWDAIQLARDYRADHDPSWKANPWVWAITFKRVA